MKSIVLVSISTVSLLMAFAAPAKLAAQKQDSVPVHYTVTDLGTLGGTFGVAYGINSSGKVGGGANLANGNQHSFRWTRSGGMQDLGTLGGPNSAAGPQAQGICRNTRNRQTSIRKELARRNQSALVCRFEGRATRRRGQ
jgi:probable HAF family extracellular repeat protein